MTQLTIGGLMHISLNIFTYKVRRYFLRNRFQSHYRSADLIVRELREKFAAQGYIHREIAKLESELNLLKSDLHNI